MALELIDAKEMGLVAHPFFTNQAGRDAQPNGLKLSWKKTKLENMAVVTVFVRIEEDREHQNRERVKSRRHVRELRLPARASQALVRELWRSGNRKRRKGIGCRKRQKTRRQARRAFNAALAESLAGEWRRRRLRERSARSLSKAWRQLKIAQEGKEGGNRGREAEQEEQG